MDSLSQIMEDLQGVNSMLASVYTAKSNEDAQYDYNEKYLEGVKQTNAQNLLLAEKQNDWNFKQWERENAYNHPAKQIQRLMEAGLSPAAAAQSLDGAGNAPSLQSADLSVMGAPQPLQAPQMDLNAVNLIGFARAVESLRSQALGNKMLREEVKYEPKRLYTQQQINEANLEALNYSVKEAAAANPYKMAGFKYDYNMKLQQYERNKLEYDIAEQSLAEARQRFGFLEKFNEAQLKEVAETLNKIKKENKLLDIEYSTKEIQKCFARWGGVPDSFSGRLAIMAAEGIINPDQIANVVDSFNQIIGYLGKGITSSLGDRASRILDSLMGNGNDDDVPNAGAIIGAAKKHFSDPAANDYPVAHQNDQ